MSPLFFFSFSHGVTPMWRTGLKLSSAASPPAHPAQLLDAIEDDVQRGGCIIDWHACDVFPRSWIDLVVVLRVESATLYDRLVERWVAPFTLPIPFLFPFPPLSSFLRVF